MPAEAVNGANGFQTSATVDGWVFPQDVMTIFKAGNRMTCRCSSARTPTRAASSPPESATGDSFKAQSQRQYGADADAFLKLYPFTTDQEARAAQAASMRDRTFGWEMRTWARLQTQTGKSKVYLYYFSHVPPLPNAAWLGAQHGAEIPYAFNWPNGNTARRCSGPRPTGSSPMQVSSYWVNFATTGDPNGTGIAEMGAVSTEGRSRAGHRRYHWHDSGARRPPP